MVYSSCSFRYSLIILNNTLLFQYYVWKFFSLNVVSVLLMRKFFMSQPWKVKLAFYFASRRLIIKFNRMHFLHISSSLPFFVCWNTFNRVKNQRMWDTLITKNRIVKAPVKNKSSKLYLKVCSVQITDHFWNISLNF